MNCVFKNFTSCVHKNRKVLNINKYYESEYMDGAP